MGCLGHKQRTDLNEEVSAIKKSGGSVTLGGAEMNSGADLARGLEGALGADMTADQVNNILARMASIKYRIEVFADCQKNPDCQPKPDYSTCQLIIELDGFVEEIWQ